MPNDRVQLGKIDIEKKFSFFEVEQGMEMAVLTASEWQNVQWKGRTCGDQPSLRGKPEHTYFPDKKKGRRDGGRSGRRKKSKHRKGGRRNFG